MNTTYIPGHLSVRALAAVLVTLLCTVTRAQAASRTATLEAIHNLENPRDLTRPGPHGELGAYQFRVSTWQIHTVLPFRQALDRRTSDIIAVQHYEYIKRTLESANVSPTTYNIALAWNGGLTGAITGRAPRAARAYAERAANLAAVLDRPQLVADAR